MENYIKIGDFIKLTGSTLKTVLYYHKIGLLPEAERSQGGYRLYGPAELTRMQMIKHLKELGIDLARIKEILGGARGGKTMREVLQSLQTELLIEKESLEERLARIDRLLSDADAALGEENYTSPSFQMIADILGKDKMEKYTQDCPELYCQQRKVYSILDDFQWGEDYRETFRELADFFREHPEKYQVALDLGRRLAGLSQMSENDPEVEALARESAQLIKSMPQLKEILDRQNGIKEPLAGLYDDMVATVIPPAQIRHGQLLKQYLASDTGES